MSWSIALVLFLNNTNVLDHSRRFHVSTFVSLKYYLFWSLFYFELCSAPCTHTWSLKWAHHLKGCFIIAFRLRKCGKNVFSVLSPHFERFHHYLNRAFVLLVCFLFLYATVQCSLFFAKKTGSSLRSDGSLLYEEFKFFSEMTWNLALCAGERMLHFDAKDFFFRFKEFQSLAHLYHSSFQEKDKIGMLSEFNSLVWGALIMTDVLYKIKLSLILCACALLETASTYSLSDQKAVSASHEALLYVNECRGLCHVNDFNSPDLKYLVSQVRYVSSCRAKSSSVDALCHWI